MRSRVISACCALIGLGILRTLSSPVPLLATSFGSSPMTDGGPLMRLLGRAGLVLGRLSDSAWRLDIACLIGVAVLATLVARSHLLCRHQPNRM